MDLLFWILFIFPVVILAILVLCSRSVVGVIDLTATLVAEEGTMLKYRIGLGEPKANDVVARKLTVIVVDSEGAAVRDDVVDLPGEARDYELLVEQGHTVSLSLIDVDDAGNESAESDELVFEAKDTIPPGRPDAPTLDLIEEI